MEDDSKMTNDNRTEHLRVRLTKDEYADLMRVCEAEGVTASRLIQQKVRELAVQSPVSEWE